MKLWNDRRLHLSITRLGLEYLAAMLLVGVFSVNTGNNLLYLIFSLMTALFLVSGWVSRRTIAHIHLDRIEEGNIFARVRGGIRVRLRDDAPRRIRALELRLETEGGRVEPGFYPGGEGREDALVVLHARPERRGWCRLRSLELRTAYPFGFLEKAWRFPLDQTILVLPHPRVVAPRTGRRGESKRFVSKLGVAAPEGARPFREGDPVSRVHWKRTAQRGAPWVRTFEDEEPIGLRLRLDLRLWSPGPAFEKELENLSGAILQARLQKQEVFLEIQSSTGRLESQGFAAGWRALALAEAEGALPSFSGSALASAGPRD
jgi:uncharacterized protein (DUF58 family)